MTDLDANIQNFPSSVQSTGHVSPADLSITTTGPDTGLSSIEKSKAVLMILVPPMDFPILISPSSQNDDSFAVMMKTLSTGEGQQAMTYFLHSIALSESQIANEILDKWAENIRRIDEEVRKLITSTWYIQQEVIRVNGNRQPTATDGVDPATGVVQPAILSTLDRLQNIEWVSGTEATSPTSPDNQMAQAAVPLIAAVLVGGALTMGVFEMTVAAPNLSSTPLVGAVELTGQLQPLIPTLIQDVLPTINLMIPFVYFSSWDATVASAGRGDKKQYQEMAIDFAKAVVAFINDPKSSPLLAQFVSKFENAGEWTTKYFDQVIAFAKFIFASVALSLLYTIEVGKESKGRFLGMTSEEFRDLLNGTLPLKDPSTPDLSDNDKLKWQLVGALRQDLLASFSTEERTRIIENLLHFLESEHKMEALLDPARIFSELSHFSSFDVGKEGLRERQV